jgi:endogenous inhibitor of DNA gyrase (YacG/DUF329 family)
MAKCRQCGAEIDSGSKNKKYCSTKCKNEFLTQHYVYIKTFTCVNCGKVFQRQTRNPNVKYCSNECINEHKKKRKELGIIINPNLNHPRFGNLNISKEFQDYLMTEILTLEYEEFREIFELGKYHYFSNKRLSEANC